MGTDRVGQTLGDRYRVARLVASGGMGDVYEAEHIYIHKRVALKLLRSDLATDDAAVQRLHREAQATSAIGHENIVRIEDFGFTSDGVVFLAMEWIDGETLEELIARGPVPLADALEIAYQVCKGLAAAHAAGVVHRDLKPANIFVMRDDAGAPKVKLVDFGIAKLLFDDAGITQTGMIVGTPHYMSPEQGQGEAVDHRADIYALGIILYELVTGQVPFKHTEFFAVLHDHAITKPVPPSQVRRGLGITPVLEAMILRCLEKEPKDRFQDMVELQRAIDSVRGTGAGPVSRGASAERPRTAPRESLSPPTKEQPAVIVQESESLEFPAARRRGGPLFIAALGILVAGLAGTLTFVYLSGRTKPSDPETPAALDAAPAPPDATPVPSKTLRMQAEGAVIRVKLSPYPIASPQFTLEIAVVSAEPDLEAIVATGRLTATVEYHYYRDHSLAGSADLAIGSDGRAVEPEIRTLGGAGKYHVTVVVRDGALELLRTRFDLCVAGGPCPDMPDE